MPSLYAALAVVALLACAGCGTKTEEKAPSTATDAVVPAFRIIATDDGLHAPDSLAAGTRHIVLENRGTQVHEAMFIQLAKGMTGDDYVAAVKSGSAFPEGARDFSGPGLTSPGEVVEMWLDLDPGDYILMCWNNEHAIHEFSVHESDKPGDAPPRADAVLRMIDFRFQLEGILRKGTQIVRIDTPGPSMHEVDIFRLHDTKTVEDIKGWRKRKTKERGLPPAQALGGALDSHDRKSVWLRRTFSPGRYVLICGMPVSMDASPSSDATHADAGMVAEFEIDE